MHMKYMLCISLNPPNIHTTRNLKRKKRKVSSFLASPSGFKLMWIKNPIDVGLLSWPHEYVAIKPLWPDVQTKDHTSTIMSTVWHGNGPPCLTWTWKLTIAASTWSGAASHWRTHPCHHSHKKNTLVIHHGGRFGHSSHIPLGFSVAVFSL
jgi:hypothetical protein